MGSNVSASGSAGTYRRRAYHAGSWYENDSEMLRETLDGYLRDASDESSAKSTAITSAESNNNNILLRGLIVPHAGYSYSGPTAAYAYLRLRRELQLQQQQQQQQKQQQPQMMMSSTTSTSTNPITTTKTTTIVVLHPSHHVYLENNCVISGASVIETPVGNLEVDAQLREEILGLSKSSKNKFGVMEQRTDEEEHSGEMQYPYIAHVINNITTNSDDGDGDYTRNIKILPIMCGALSNQSEKEYGRLLAPILSRPNIITIVSSDFCHWGSRFAYRPTPSSGDQLPIHEFIESLDRQGMSLIELQQPGAFASYLSKTKNTICGRHAIAVYLNAITNSNETDSNGNQNQQQIDINFVRYEQSSHVQSMNDSSVSYAAAIVTTTSTSTSSGSNALPN